MRTSPRSSTNGLPSSRPSLGFRMVRLGLTGEWGSRMWQGKRRVYEWGVWVFRMDSWSFVAYFRDFDWIVNGFEGIIDYTILPGLSTKSIKMLPGLSLPTCFLTFMHWMPKKWKKSRTILWLYSLPSIISTQSHTNQGLMGTRTIKMPYFFNSFWRSCRSADFQAYPWHLCGCQ